MAANGIGRTWDEVRFTFISQRCASPPFAHLPGSPREDCCCHASAILVGAASVSSTAQARLAAVLFLGPSRRSPESRRQARGDHQRTLLLKEPSPIGDCHTHKRSTALSLR